MPAWFSPKSASFGDRNGESIFVTAETLERSNFEQLYQGTGETPKVDADILCAAFQGTVNAMVMHYWATRDYEVKLETIGEEEEEELEHASPELEAAPLRHPGHEALHVMYPEWRRELMGRYRVGSDPAATVRLYTSETEVLIRRVFKNCSVCQDGSAYPPGTEFPPGLTRQGFGRPLSLAATDEAGKATHMLFRPFELPRNIPGVDYDAFINTNFSEWTGNTPLRFFERKPFYKALNAALTQDAPNVLRNVIPIIRDMNFYINQTRHDGGLLFSGVGIGSTQGLVQSSVGKKLRLPRFLSASKDQNLAIAHLKCKVGPALLKIHVPAGFHGARDVEDITMNPGEHETLFCAYSLFKVFTVKENSLFVPPVLVVELIALDKYDEMAYEFYPSLTGDELLD